MTNETTPQGNIKSRVVAAGSWTLFGFGAAQALRLASNLIMTRLLVPEMFGLLAATMTFLFIVHLVTDFGIQPSIIQSKRGEEQRFLNTAWVMQILRGFVLMIALIIVAFTIDAGTAAGYFKDDTAYANEVFPMVLIIMSTTLFIGGFTSTNLILANRRIQLGRLTIVNLLSQILGLVVMICWAVFYEASVWALVAGTVTNSSVQAILSHICFEGKSNRFEFDVDSFKEIFHFGKWVFVSSVISAIYFQADRLFLGYFENAAIFGVYTIALFISTAVRDLLEKVISNVLFPLLSEISRDNREKLVDYYFLIRMRTDAMSVFCAGLLFASATPIIRFLYDDRYIDAGWMLQILALTLLFTSPFVTRALMLSIGNSKYTASLRAMQLAALAITMPLLYVKYNIEGVLWSLVVVQFLAFIYDLFYRMKKNATRWFHEVKMYPMVVLGYFVGIALNQFLNALPDF